MVGSADHDGHFRAASPAETVRRADDLRRAGRLEEAAQTFRSLLALGDEIGSEGLHQLSRMLQALGDLDGACDAARRATGRGASADVLFDYADLSRRLGRLEDALAGFDSLLQAYPDHAAGRLQKAVVLAGLGRLEAAVAAYDAAAALDPLSARLFNNRGAALEALGQAEAALESYQAALNLKPDYAQAWHNKGSALFRLGRLQLALESFDQALALQPDSAETHNFRGVALQRRGSAQEALTSFDRALALRRNFADAWSNRSVCLMHLRRFEEARQSAAAAVALRPDFPEALSHLAAALVRLNRTEDAVPIYRKALERAPNDASLHQSLGVALDLLEAWDEALEHFNTAMRLDPLAPEPVYSSGLILIRRGAIKAGFERFDVRWSQKDGPPLRYDPRTLWRGDRDIRGRILLVHAEQGLGDVLQFCRFASLAADRGARVILEAQAALVPLLRRLRGVDEVVAFSEVPPAFDDHVPVMSLVRALDLSMDDLAPSTPYLQPAKATRTRWEAVLPKGPRPRVGLAWSGNPKHFSDLNRSMALEVLAPVLSADVEFVTLQREFRADDLPYLAASGVRRFDQALVSFEETAGLVERCDLVLSVDTSVAHLAGALGKPVLLMLSRPCDFRWMTDRPDTPWYPSFRLARQGRRGDWSAVVEAAQALVAAL